MKKYFTFGLVISMVSGACFAQHPMIAQLIAEKQAKMKKLEDCQGTTKKLKIAGISTLGITAVGVAGNIAEAVVLKDARSDLEKAKKAYNEQDCIKNHGGEWVNGECKDKPVEKEEKNSEADKNDDDKGGEKSDGANGNGDQEGKKTGDNDPNKKTPKGDAGKPAPQKSDEELFTEACVNAGYKMADSECHVCGTKYNIPLPRSKAYVDNALITAARKINMGCNGSIYTKENSHSYIDCLGGRLWCWHRTTAIEDDTKKQAEALLTDIKDEKYWENARQQEKQVKVPLKPTPEQAKQPKPQVSLKPEVLKNIERADEIINNKPLCKDDEEFNYIINACVKK